VSSAIGLCVTCDAVSRAGGAFDASAAPAAVAKPDWDGQAGGRPARYTFTACMLSYQSADIIPRSLSRLLLLTVMRKRTDDFFLLRGDRSVVRGVAPYLSPAALSCCYQRRSIDLRTRVMDLSVVGVIGLIETMRRSSYRP